MRIFVAGGTGTIGVPLVRALIAAGHEVHSLTRSEKKILEIRSLGAEPAVADALDAEGLRRVVVAARPMHVIHQLTALPKQGPRRSTISRKRSRQDGRLTSIRPVANANP